MTDPEHRLDEAEKQIMIALEELDLADVHVVDLEHARQSVARVRDDRMAGREVETDE